MSSIIIRFVVAAVFITAAVMAWAASEVADALADRHHRLVTLQFGDAAGAPDGRAAPLARMLDATAPSHAGLHDYWAARYGVLADASDPELLLLAANAIFRTAQRESGVAGMERLERALQAYAAVLKNSDSQNSRQLHDAAYNYEYVARLRDAAARARPGVARRVPPAPTLHGRPGAHPPNTRGDEFEVITPMDYGDREAQPEPTPGQRRPRKG